MNQFFQWKLNQVRIWSHHLFLYNSRSLLNVDFAYTERFRKKFLCLYDKLQKVQSRFDFNESWNDQVRIRSHHLFLYNFRSLLNVDFAYKRWVRRKIFVCKRIFKKCNLSFFDRFWESWDDEKSFAIHVLCESVASSDTEAELRLSHVMWLRWLCIGRNNSDPGTQHI
jgi:hypothetical protein